MVFVLAASLLCAACKPADTNFQPGDAVVFTRDGVYGMTKEVSDQLYAKELDPVAAVTKNAARIVKQPETGQVVEVQGNLVVVKLSSDGKTVFAPGSTLVKKAK